MINRRVVVFIKWQVAQDTRVTGKRIRKMDWEPLIMLMVLPILEFIRTTRKMAWENSLQKLVLIKNKHGVKVNS